MNLDTLRFETTRRASDVYCEHFQKLGIEQTEQIIRGVLDASRGALAGIKGEAFAYSVFVRISDDIAKSMIESGERK
jgi:hypothetical protein